MGGHIRAWILLICACRAEWTEGLPGWRFSCPGADSYSMPEALGEASRNVIIRE